MLSFRIANKGSVFLGCFLGVFLLLISACSETSPQNEQSLPTPTATSYSQYDQMFADWAPRYVDCARKYGANASIGPDQSINIPYAQGRPVKDGLDAECLKEIGPPPETPPLTQSFLVGLYELLVKQADCLRDHGYTIPPPPSRQVWVENYGAGSWDPLMELYAVNPEDDIAMVSCPQPNPRDAEELGNEIANSGG